jgi:hypothetical protein
MSSISDAEPSSFEEANKLQVWKYVMLEEYRSILKNNVWDIVPRPEDKYVVCIHVMCMLRSSHASHVKGEFLTEVISSVLILTVELMVSSNSNG